MRYLASIIFILVILFIPTQASAHVLKTDGSVGAILHVSPDDDPIVGAPTDFFFELKDTSGKLKPENCDCVVQVIHDGKIDLSTKLFMSNPSPSLDDASFKYFFPKKGIYKVQLIGTPKTEGAFERFELSWDVRVARDAAGQTATSSGFNLTNALPYIFALLVVVIFVGMQLSKKKKGYKK